MPRTILPQNSTFRLFFLTLENNSFNKVVAMAVAINCIPKLHSKAAYTRAVPEVQGDEILKFWE